MNNYIIILTLNKTRCYSNNYTICRFRACFVRYSARHPRICQCSILRRIVKGIERGLLAANKVTWRWRGKEQIMFAIRNTKATKEKIEAVIAMESIRDCVIQSSEVTKCGNEIDLYGV